ncbi:hypothetical protein BRADI_3g04556v3 [Brachypodium distachyon]|uniref:Uncharacterized protein n=1 Tax=Brachypodium distachyon TaxID=15368 RepID=A0A0Q3F1P1_BRADI|nr:hypothetical protein BRADI_3g04556v3 [Brachypodium distachyon]
MPRRPRLSSGLPSRRSPTPKKENTPIQTPPPHRAAAAVPRGLVEARPPLPLRRILPRPGSRRRRPSWSRGVAQSRDYLTPTPKTTQPDPIPSRLPSPARHLCLWRRPSPARTERPSPLFATSASDAAILPPSPPFPRTAWKFTKQGEGCYCVSVSNHFLFYFVICMKAQLLTCKLCCEERTFVLCASRKASKSRY